jgi:hypothetical protein
VPSKAKNYFLLSILDSATRYYSYNSNRDYTCDRLIKETVAKNNQDKLTIYLLSKGRLDLCTETARSLPATEAEFN